LMPLRQTLVDNTGVSSIKDVKSNIYASLVSSKTWLLGYVYIRINQSLIAIDCNPLDWLAALYSLGLLSIYSLGLFPCTGNSLPYMYLPCMPIGYIWQAPHPQWVCGDSVHSSFLQYDWSIYFWNLVCM